MIMLQYNLKHVVPYLALALEAAGKALDYQVNK